MLYILKIENDSGQFPTDFGVFFFVQKDNVIPKAFVLVLSLHLTSFVHYTLAHKKRWQTLTWNRKWGHVREVNPKYLQSVAILQLFETLQKEE